jgi:hypothetical protein
MNASWPRQVRRPKNKLLCRHNPAVAAPGNRPRETDVRPDRHPFLVGSPRRTGKLWDVDAPSNA